jgi:hypothetical protein
MYRYVRCELPKLAERSKSEDKPSKGDKSSYIVLIPKDVENVLRERITEKTD